MNTAFLSSKCPSSGGTRLRHSYDLFAFSSLAAAVMPAPGSLVNTRRLLAHGLGLGMLTGGVMLGAQGAANALQYVFTGAVDPADGLQLDFASPGCDTLGGILLGYCYTGSGQVTGSFDFAGGNIINNINVSFESNTGNTQNFAFNTGYYDNTNDILYFGITSGTCPATGNPTCLALNLSGSGLTSSPGETVTFEAGDDALGDYFNLANTSGGLLGDSIPNNNRNLTFLSGTLRQIPAPLSALALLPLAGLKRYRRRLRHRTGLITAGLEHSARERTSGSRAAPATVGPNWPAP